MADTESAAAAAADVVPTGTEDDGAAVVTETPVAAEGDAAGAVDDSNAETNDGESKEASPAVVDKPPAPTIDESEFNDQLKALKGQKVLVQPRVSRETIIDVLFQHTNMLRGIKHDMVATKATVSGLVNLTDKHSAHIGTLQQEMVEEKDKIVRLETHTSKMQQEIEQIKETLGELSNIKKEQRYLRQTLADITANITQTKLQIKESFEAVDSSLYAMDVMNKETQSLLIQLKEYVDHFGDNLILASTQITVESKVGFSDRPMSLQDVLKLVNKQNSKIEFNIEDHNNRINENADVISTKADGTVQLEVNILDGKVSAIEDHLQKEADEGVSALRKNCEELSSTVDHVLADMAEKIDKKSVDLIVHNKYEDIVEYLQQALHADEEDGETAAAKAKAIQEQMTNLSKSKADRQEIATIQEALVKAENKVAKMTKLVEQGPKDTLSKSDIERMLFNKVDKEEYSEQMTNILKTIKKNRKHSIMHGGNFGEETAGTPNNMPGMNRSQSMMLPGVPGGRGQRLPNVMTGPASGDGDNRQLFIRPTTSAQDPGVFETPGEVGGVKAVGGYSFSHMQQQPQQYHQSQSYPNAHNGGMNPSFQMPSPQIHARVSFANNVSKGYSASPQNIQPEHQQNENTKSSNSLLAVTIPVDAVPGSTFVVDHNGVPINVVVPSGSRPGDGIEVVLTNDATTGNIMAYSIPDDNSRNHSLTKNNIQNNDNDNISSSSMKVNDGWNLKTPSASVPTPPVVEDKEHLPPSSMVRKGGHGQDLSVLGSPTKGGGFNEHGKGGVKEGGLKGLSNVDPDGPDIEVSGLMVTGTDGKQYYSDQINEDTVQAGNSSVMIPKVKTAALQ